MAFDAYLKIDGLEGESTSKGMEKQIEVESFSWDIVNSASASSQTGGISAGRANINAFTVVKIVDKASPVYDAAGSAESQQHVTSVPVCLLRQECACGRWLYPPLLAEGSLLTSRSETVNPSS